MSSKLFVCIAELKHTLANYDEIFVSDHQCGREGDAMARIQLYSTPQQLDLLSQLSIQPILIHQNDP
jgi:hypothetical protein